MSDDIFPQTPGRLSVDVWSDVMCPFCYMGDALLDRALARFPHADGVDVRYHSFLLMPELSSTEPADIATILSEKRGVSREQATAMNDQVAARGRQLGLDYRFDRAKTVNMRSAHQLSHFAADHGKQREAIHRLFLAYFTEGRNVADLAVLADIADEAGLDREAATAALAQGTYAGAVENDLRVAAQLGISGVPFFVFGGKYAVSGAQPEDAFVQALTTAWDETVEPAPVD